MRALLIRHGQTPGNAEGRYIGRTDEPLSAEGRAAAARVKPDFSPRLVYVSPLKRARETAELLFPSAEQLVLPGLREMDFGDFEGRSAAELGSDPAYRAWVDGWCLASCPNGEDRLSFQRRAVAAFVEALREAEDPAVFVVHGGVVMAVLEALAEPRREFYDYWLPNLGCYEAECVETDGGLTLRNVRQIELRKE